MTLHKVELFIEFRITGYNHEKDVDIDLSKKYKLDIPYLAQFLLNKSLLDSRYTITEEWVEDSPFFPRLKISWESEESISAITFSIWEIRNELAWGWGTERENTPNSVVDGYAVYVMPIWWDLHAYIDGNLNVWMPPLEYRHTKENK